MQIQANGEAMMKYEKVNSARNYADERPWESPNRKEV
jgi:hypothetical protein